MATLTDDQLASIRRRMDAAQIPGYSHTKPRINALLQAFENFLEDTVVKADVFSRVDIAIPGISSAEKDAAWKFFLSAKGEWD